MLEGLLSTTGLRPQSLEAFTGSFSQSKEISERSLTAAFSAEGDDRETRITLSERAFSSLQESRISLARTAKGDEAEDFSRGVDRASRRIGRALERFVSRLERLQDRAEAIGERLSERIREDIEAGRFDDRTPLRLASKLLRQAGRIERAAERLTDRLGDAFERSGGTTDKALTVDFSQSISLSVQQVEIEIQDGDKSISVSYQKIVFESTTTLGISFAQDTPEVTDPDDPAGSSLSTAALEAGVYVNAAAGQAEAPAVDATAAETDDPTVPAPPAAQPGLTTGQSALLLIQQFSFESSSTRFSFDVAARTGASDQSGFGASYQSSQFDFAQQTTRLLALTA